MKETLGLVSKTISENKQLHHVVVNAGKIVAMQKDAALRKSVNESDIINADGQAVVWAAKMLGKPLKERVAGIDLMEKYNLNIIAGYRNGYFTPEDEPQIAQQIASSGAHMLFVAITSPIKENFLYNHRALLKDVPFVMGVGGSFDVVSGLTKRAPVWMQNAGLEWFYRFLQEPKRMWKRYLVGNSTFIWMVLKEKFSSK